MSTYGFIASSEDLNIYHHQYFGILAYSVNHNLGHVEFVEEAEYGLEDLNNRNLVELVKKLVDGDVLIVSDTKCFGRSAWEIIGVFIEILKRGAVACAVVGQYDLGGHTMFRGLPCVLEVLSAARTELALTRSKEQKSSNCADRTVALGKPVGRLGVSRMNGREEEIVKLLESGVTKAEVARRMSVSRPALHDFCVSRKLLQNS